MALTVAQVQAQNGGAGWLSASSIQAIIDRFPSDDNAVLAAVLWAKAVTWSVGEPDLKRIDDLVAASTNPGDTKDVLSRIQDQAISQAAARLEETFIPIRRDPFMGTPPTAFNGGPLRTD